MKLTGSSVFLVLAMFKATEAYAQADCPKELKWTDATYAQRITTKNGQVVKADSQAFANASIAHLSFDGARSAKIEVFSKNRTSSIQLTFGGSKPNPVEFAEISMVVEPPMANGAWPRMMGPCSLPDGVNIDFDEADIPAFTKEHAQATPRFKGTLRRSGLHISYAMMVEDGETWQGEVNYSRELKKFDLHTDVQGWHVFRANAYVETLPVGKPVPMLSVIEKMALSKQTK
jgi:predicted methyltransferase